MVLTYEHWYCPCIGMNGMESGPISFPQMGNLVGGKGDERKKKHRRMRSSGGNKSLDLTGQGEG